MLSAIEMILKPLMLFNGIRNLNVKFNIESQAIEIKYTDLSDKPGITVMPFADIEAQINGTEAETQQTTPTR